MTEIAAAVPEPEESAEVAQAKAALHAGRVAQAEAAMDWARRIADLEQGVAVATRRAKRGE